MKFISLVTQIMIFIGGFVAIVDYLLAIKDGLGRKYLDGLIKIASSSGFVLMTYYMHMAYVEWTRVSLWYLVFGFLLTSPHRAQLRQEGQSKKRP